MLLNDLPMYTYKCENDIISIMRFAIAQCFFWVYNIHFVEYLCEKFIVSTLVSCVANTKSHSWFPMIVVGYMVGLLPPRQGRGFRRGSLNHGPFRSPIWWFVPRAVFRFFRVKSIASLALIEYFKQNCVCCAAGKAMKEFTVGDNYDKQPRAAIQIGSRRA